jgi:phage major head subunit gpT-like protein
MAEFKMFDLQLFDVAPTTANTIHYTDADRDNKTGFGKLLEPGLRKIFFETYDELPEQYSHVYNLNTSSKAKETDFGLGAFGDWTKRASQLSEVDYKTLSPGLERTYTHEAFTQGFMVTREMHDDDQYRQIEKMPKAMARAGRAKVEKDAMTTLVNGFFEDANADLVNDNPNIYDGEALFSDNHPLLDSAGVGSNLITGVLNDANLKKAIQKMREIPDEAGNLAQFKVTKLIVPPALEDTAIRLVGSDRITGTANNDTNKFLKQYGIEVVVMDYLGAGAGGSDTAWYVQDGSRHELNFFWRVRPEFKWEEDFDTLVAKYRGYMRYSFGVSDWRGIIGSTGV